MLDALRGLRPKGAFPELGRSTFGRLMTSLARHKCWVVYAKAPFKRSDHVLSYLGRYTHRVGIANSRLLDVGPGHVTFRTKGKGTATLHPVAFLARFIQHVLPDGLHKIRHAGLYASARPGGLLEHARARLPGRPDPKTIASITEHEPQRCPRCGGLIQRIRLARAPPEAPCV